MNNKVYKYGIDITNATLQTYAYELGLEKTVTEMTQMEKMQLRVLAILNQSRVSWGDLANTINSPSNMMRQFTNNIKETGMVFGQLFIPVLQRVMPVVNGITIAIKRLLVSIASLMGIKLDLSSFGQGFSGVDDGLEDVTDGFDSATASAKKFKTYVLGIDELNIQPQQTDSSGGGGGIGSDFIDLTDEIIAATEEYETVFNEAVAKMENLAQEWADAIYGVFEPLEDMFSNLTLGNKEMSAYLAGVSFSDFFMQFLDIDWDEVYESASGFGSGLANFLNGLIDNPNDFKIIGSSAMNSINAVLVGLNDFGKKFKWGKFGVSLASGIKGFLAKWNPGLTADTLSNFASGLFNAMTSAINELAEGDDFKELGQKVVDFVCNIRWGELVWDFADFYNAFNDALAKIPSDFAVGIGEGIMQNIFGDSDYEVPSEIRELSQSVFAIMNPLTGIFTKIEGTINGWKMVSAEAVEYVKQKFQELPQPVQDVFNNIKETFTEAKENLNQTWGNIKEWFQEKFESVWEVFSGFSLRVAQLFEGIWIIWQAIFSSIVEWIQENFVEPVVERFTETKENVEEVWGGVSKWFKENVIDKIAEGFRGLLIILQIFSTICEGIKRVFATGMNVIISFIEAGVNWIIDAINGMLEGFNEVAGKAAELIGEDYSGVSLINNISLPRIEGYARGGFPDEYSLFMAGEGGRAEMLGTVGGRTAVAGGAEITGIRDAVYQSSQTEAELLREQNELLRQLLAKDTSVNIGDRDIARANARGSRSMGYALIT